MSNTEHEQFYFVDPGIGKKGKGCPYTYYKDGHDIKSYITPPKGYELTGFKFEPTPDDKFYDGKIIAQYEKTPFSDRVRERLGIYILGSIAIIGIIGIIAFYTSNFRSKPKLATQPVQKPKTEVKVVTIDTTTKIQTADASAISESTLITEDTLIEEPETEEIALDEVVDEEIAETVNEEIAQVEEQPIEVPIENNVKENEVTPTVTETKAQSTEPEEVLTKEQFRKEFWELIHHKETHMRTYGNLYRKYKSLNLKSREFYYLYLTILENTTAFDVWKAKLVSIPDDELKSIHNISALEQKIEEYQ